MDEIEEKTKAYRASANVAAQDDGTTLGVSIIMYLSKFKLNPHYLVESFSIGFSIQWIILHL